MVVKKIEFSEDDQVTPIKVTIYFLYVFALSGIAGVIAMLLGENTIAGTCFVVFFLMGYCLIFTIRTKRSPK